MADSRKSSGDAVQIRAGSPSGRERWPLLQLANAGAGVNLELPLNSNQPLGNNGVLFAFWSAGHKSPPNRNKF